MSFQFRDALQGLQKEPWPVGAPLPQFLSVSFDPEYDTPQRLQRYASTYRSGTHTNWLFAAVPKEDLSDFTARCGLELTAEKGSISHNLRTVVLTPDGRVARIFKGNEWSPEQLRGALLTAAQNRP